LLLNLGYIIPLWKLHFILKMLAQSSKFFRSFAIGWLTVPLMSLTLVSSTSSTWLKIWRLVGAIVTFCQLNVSSKVVMGVVNTFETYMVLIIKVISWPIPIWCGVRGKVANRNSKGLVPLSSTCLICSLTNLSLPSTNSVVVVVT